jgi:23S rRNA (adenine2030-N6)-methyltransferase
MNYRHAYHAGNFADVLKHAVLAFVIDHLKRKDAPFRIVDTHAGRGRYALMSAEADKTGEWRAGIGRLVGVESTPLPDTAQRLLAPYLAAVAAENGGHTLSLYPGSPLIAQHLMRTGDTLIANELHPDERTELEAAIGRDRRVKILGLDGWTALKSLLPPKERRGVVLIDPPFEEDGELRRLGDGLTEALQRFATGTFIAWHPIKDPQPVARFRKALAAAVERPPLAVELMIRRPTNRDRLNGCGLVVANPPYTLQAALKAALPELTRRMAQDTGASHNLDWLGSP